MLAPGSQVLTDFDDVLGFDVGGRHAIDGRARAAGLRLSAGKFDVADQLGEGERERIVGL